MSKNKPQTARVIPWLDIEHRYADLIDDHGWRIEPLYELVKHIRKAKLSERLFAFTSMDRLVIGIYDPMEWNREALHVEFDDRRQTFNFSYYSMPDVPVEFERQYPAEEGINKFDMFIKLMKW